jgi:hypothetical protein
MVSPNTRTEKFYKMSRLMKFPDAKRTEPFRRMAILLLLVATIWLTLAGVMDRWIYSSGVNILYKRSFVYVEDATEQTLATFGVLSTLKIGLAVIEGSEVGFGFGLEVGDVVQAAYDYVDIAWRVILIAGVVLVGTQYALEAASLIDQWSLVFLCISLLAACAANWWIAGWYKLTRLLWAASLLGAVMTAALYFLLPLSINGGAYLSRQITAPSIQKAQSGISEISESLFPEARQEAEETVSRWVQTKEQLNRLIDILKDKTSELILSILKLIAGYLFDCLVFPVGLFLLLLWLTKMAISHLGEISQPAGISDIEKRLANLIRGRGKD